MAKQQPKKAVEIATGGDQWKLIHEDCVEEMHKMPDASIDMALYSPPFPAVYAYSSRLEDIGNSEDQQESKLHLSFFYRQILRLLKPGRVMMVHVAQIPRMKRAGEQGLNDFRGLNIRLAERAGFVFEYDWLVRKNPQSQALRGKAWELKFQGLESDRAASRGALPDYLLKFRRPGKNEVKINTKNEVSRNDWIKWAEACWDDIIETDTLNVAEGRGENDVRHVAPLQLEVIRRLILLYTNPGELVFSPFAGIGSEGFMALGGKSPKTGKCIVNPRRFLGCELKDEYFATAKLNLARAVEQHAAAQQGLLWEVEQTEEVEIVEEVEAVPAGVAVSSATPAGCDPAVDLWGGG